VCARNMSSWPRGVREGPHIQTFLFDGSDNQRTTFDKIA
jgi:hypothetical protein